MLNKVYEVPTTLTIAVLFFTTVTLFRFIHVFLSPPEVEAISDGLRHWMNAKDTLAVTPTANWDPPLYQIYLATIQKLCGEIPGLYYWFTGLLSVANLFAWYWPLSKLLPKQSALLAAGTLGLAPGWVGLYSFILNETLFLPLLGCALGATFDCLQEKSSKSFILASLLWFLTSLTRGIGLPLGVVAVFGMLTQLSKKEGFRGIGITLLITLPILIPMGIRTYDTYQLIHPFGSYRGNEIMARTGAFTHTLKMKKSGSEWGYTFDSARGTDLPLAPLSNYQTVRDGSVHIEIDLTDGNKREKISRPFLSVSDGLKVIGDDLIFTLFGVPWPHVSKGSAYSSLGWYTRWIWALSFCLLPILLWLYKPLSTEEHLLVWLIMIWVTIQVGGLFIPGQSRYRLPYEALIFMLTCSFFFRKRV